MKHMDYHLISDQHNLHTSTLDEAKHIAEELKNSGDTHIELSVLTAEESGVDQILLSEETISEDELFNID